MRVLHVVGDSAYGGGSRIIAALAERAQSEGHEVSVLTTCGPFGAELARRGINVIPLDCIWRPIRPWRDLVGLLRLWTHLRRSRYDLVHTHTSKAGFIGRLAARLAGTPIVVHTVHGFAFHERSPRAVIAGVAAVERLAGRWADRLVTVSEHLRGQTLALRVAPPNRVVAIPNGVACPPASSTSRPPPVRRELGIPDGVTVLLTTGRLAPLKGLEDLIAALPAIVREARRPVCLLLAGDGPLAASLRRQASAVGCDEQVRFLGFRTDVWDLLAAADVVILPSVREGLSISMLEAMAMGRPIVATTIPSNTEASDDGRGALLVAGSDPEGLASAVLSLIQDRESARQLAAIGKALHARRYTEERMLARYMELYRDLSGNESGSMTRRGGRRVGGQGEDGA